MKSNRSSWRKIILMLSFMGCAGFIFSQDFINIRKISLLQGDTNVVAGILADVKLEKVNPVIFYSWYSNGNIYSNQGGYSGNLLHGEYIEYDNEGHLLLKGAYYKGVKSGRWLYWFESGELKEIIEYEGGQIEGKHIKYAEDGRILYSANYKKNLLHGVKKEVINDTLFRFSFRNGIEKRKDPLYVF